MSLARCNFRDENYVTKFALEGHVKISNLSLFSRQTVFDFGFLAMRLLDRLGPRNPTIESSNNEDTRVWEMSQIDFLMNLMEIFRRQGYQLFDRMIYRIEARINAENELTVKLFFNVPDPLAILPTDVIWVQDDPNNPGHIDSL